MNTEPTLTLTLSGGRTSFEPGETIEGTVSWAAAPAASQSSVEVRLFWFTGGDASQDLGIVDTMAVPAPHATGRASFVFSLPDAPYSFVGRLITLTWAVEAIFEPGSHAARVEIVVAPKGRLVNLRSADDLSSR